VQWATLSGGGPIGGRIYCAAANSVGYRLIKPSPEVKADYLAGSTRFAKLRGQVGFLGSYPTETPSLERDVTRIEAPVQVLHGEFDTFVSVSNSRRLADLLPNSRFAVIPGAAHYAWEDNITRQTTSKGSWASSRRWKPLPNQPRILKHSTHQSLKEIK